MRAQRDKVVGPLVGQARSSLRTALSLSLSGLPSVAVKPRPSVRPLPEMRLVVELVILRCFVVKGNRGLCGGMMSCAPSSKSIVLIHLAFVAACPSSLSVFLTRSESKGRVGNSRGIKGGPWVCDVTAEPRLTFGGGVQSIGLA